MSELRVELEDGRTRFAPGERIRGTAGWRLEEPAEALEVRLFWFTRGKGERDVGIVETLAIDSATREGSREFSFRAPPAPLSFSGKLISLIWSIELVALPDGEAGRQEILLSRTGEEIRLGSLEGDELDDEATEPG